MVESSFVNQIYFTNLNIRINGFRIEAIFDISENLDFNEFCQRVSVSLKDINVKLFIQAIKVPMTSDWVPDIIYTLTT
jgi:hypothetical protein